VTDCLLNDRTRQRSAAILQARLCDTLDLEFKFRQIQWRFVGADVRSFCPLFRLLATETAHLADLIAGRIMSLVETPDVRPATIARLTALESPPIEGSLERHIQLVAAALIQLSRLIHASAEAAQELGDPDSSQVLQHLAAQIDQQIWMLRKRLSETFVLQPASPPFH
jgi:starvation-inducible DNA-binding protein